MSSSDSEAGEASRGYYQPVAASPPMNPQAGVNVYTNELYHDGDVLRNSNQEHAPSRAPNGSNELFTSPVSSPTAKVRPASQRPGGGAKSLAAKRQERLQANLYEPNQSLARAPGSPMAGNQPSGAWGNSTARSNMAPVAGGEGSAVRMHGLSSSYDPNEEAGNNNNNNNGGSRPGQGRGQGQELHHQHQQQQQQQHSIPPPIRVDLNDIPSFLLTPGPRNGPIMCYIVRDKGSAKMYPKYNLFLEDGRRFLLAARKRKKQTTSNYLISLDLEDMGRDSETFFGKLRSNFVGTEFSVFDDGGKPGKSTGKPQREELAAVMYNYNVLGTRGPRKMTAVIPDVSPQGERMFKAKDENDGMLERAKNNSGIEDLVIMRNKPPRWNEELNAYCLNFNGRVTEASVKNFQLVSDDDLNHVICQFGKIGKNVFTMDYQWPVNALQAFGICLSSFDNKLACE